jgi:hypothetical protein
LDNYSGHDCGFVANPGLGPDPKRADGLPAVTRGVTQRQKFGISLAKKLDVCTCWRLMGGGIDWMTSIAMWVTSFPGALGRVAAFGAGPLLLCTAGLVVLCLFKTPLRLIGAVLIGGAILLMLRAPKPDVLIAAGGSAVALRGENGRLSMVKSGGDVFAFREWLAADADARADRQYA